MLWLFIPLHFAVAFLRKQVINIKPILFVYSNFIKKHRFWHSSPNLLWQPPFHSFKFLKLFAFARVLPVWWTFFVFNFEINGNKNPSFNESEWNQFNLLRFFEDPQYSLGPSLNFQPDLSEISSVRTYVKKRKEFLAIFWYPV